jgi:hypothetical protein
MSRSQLCRVKALLSTKLILEVIHNSDYQPEICKQRHSGTPERVRRDLVIVKGKSRRKDHGQAKTSRSLSKTASAMTLEKPIQSVQGLVGTRVGFR